MYNKGHCTRSEMDITPVFGTVVGGSNPSGCTHEKLSLLSFGRTRKTFSYVMKLNGKVPGYVITESPQSAQKH